MRRQNTRIPERLRQCRKKENHIDPSRRRHNRRYACDSNRFSNSQPVRAGRTTPLEMTAADFAFRPAIRNQDALPDVSAWGPPCGAASISPFGSSARRAPVRSQVLARQPGGCWRPRHFGLCSGIVRQHCEMPSRYRRAPAGNPSSGSASRPRGSLRSP
jgi:hypothetical protein